MNNCEHLEQAQDFRPKKRVCEDCVKTGDSWVHLRICLTCNRTISWRRRQCLVKPRTCQCGGALVRPQEHPKRVGGLLALARRRLAWLEAPVGRDSAQAPRGE